LDIVQAKYSCKTYMPDCIELADGVCVRLFPGSKCLILRGLLAAVADAILLSEVLWSVWVPIDQLGIGLSASHGLLYWSVRNFWSEWGGYYLGDSGAIYVDIQRLLGQLCTLWWEGGRADIIDNSSLMIWIIVEETTECIWVLSMLICGFEYFVVTGVGQIECWHWQLCLQDLLSLSWSLTGAVPSISSTGQHCCLHLGYKCLCISSCTVCFWRNSLEGFLGLFLFHWSMELWPDRWLSLCLCRECRWRSAKGGVQRKEHKGRNAKEGVQREECRGRSAKERGQETEMVLPQLIGAGCVPCISWLGWICLRTLQMNCIHH